MKTTCTLPPLDSFRMHWRKKTILFRLIFIVLIALIEIPNALSQGVIPTKGTDFWIGVPYNPPFSTRRFDVFITSDVNTTGVILIPAQGWSLPFVVAANVTTTITLPITMVENVLSEVAEMRGVQILTTDTVSVFAVVIQQYSADASLIYPKSSLGTEYMVSSYPGLVSNQYPNIKSQFIIVATEDGTQVEITPTTSTAAGRPAGVPFIVNLNRGQSYQVFANTALQDLSGTTIKGTDSSGSCRPFAVFSGNPCTNVPASCSACDILYDQCLPTKAWGKTYYAVPYGTSAYTLRVMAKQNGTTFLMNGVSSVLNAGQYIEYNNVSGTRCIQSNYPVCVIQYMQGASCSGSGDPSMMYLNSDEQRIDDVTFSTVTSTIITTHKANVIMKTAHINQLKLDGVPVPSSAFIPLAFCSTVSYANLNLTAGSHTLNADSGFTAYVYGTGGYESYSYSVGSYSKNQPIQVDSILCSTDTIQIGSSNSLFGVWWSTLTNPNDTIGLGSVLVLFPPIVPDIYIQHGNAFISGCESVLYFDIAIPDPPQITVSNTSDTACVGQKVQLNVDVLPLASNYTYTWTPSTGMNNPNIANPILTAASSQWYVVAVASSNNCAPTVYDSVFIEVYNLPLPNVSAGINQQICIGDSIHLTATGGISYVWSTGAVGASISYQPLIPTNYIVFGMDINGCVNSDTISITLNPLPNANAGVDRSICEQSSTILTASGGVSYLWTPGNFSTNPLTIIPVATTTYVVQVTSSFGCTAIDSVAVNVNPIAQANAGPDQIICTGDSVNLSAIGGIIYNWMPGAMNTNTIVVSPINTTNYVVLVNNSFNCPLRDTVKVTVMPLPNVLTNGNQQICVGDSVLISVSTSFSTLWMPGNFTGNNYFISPTSSTNYIVVITDTNSCSNSDTLRVIVQALPLINLGADTSICIGASLNLTTAVPAQNYLWWPSGAINSSINVQPSNQSVYSLSVVDVNGCKNSDTIQVSLHPVTTAVIVEDTLHSCISLNATLTASGGVSYWWMPGGGNTSSYSVSPSANTMYTVQVMDTNGCSGSDSVYMMIQPLLTGSNTSLQMCWGDQLTLNSSGGISYVWLPGGSTNDSINISPVTNTSYIVHVVQANGCLVNDTTEVNVNPLPLVSAGFDQSICLGNFTSLNASGAIAFLWLNNGSSLASMSVNPSSSTNYIVQGTDLNGCINFDSAFIQVHSLPIADAGPDQNICKNDTALLVATGGQSYLWNPFGIPNDSINVSPVSTSIYTVIVVDANGCINWDTLIVTPLSDPVAMFNISTPVCDGIEVSFVNTSSVDVGTIVNQQWNFGDGQFSFDKQAKHIYASVGEYNITLIVESDNGCMDSISGRRIVNDNPVVNFLGGKECAEQEVQFTDLSSVISGNIVKWDWNFWDGGTSTWQHAQHIFMQPGWPQVSLTVVSDSGCTSTATKSNTVEIYPLPTALFYASPFEASILDPVIHFYSESLLGNVWNWDFGDGIGFSNSLHPVYTYQDTGTFNVSLILTSIHGCLDTLLREVIITPTLTIYIPNAFTPNADGKNDFFIPEGIGFGRMYLYIFNRWGDEIFYSEDVSQGWDGRSQKENQLCAEGIYVYVVKVVDYKNTMREYNGQVSLIR